MANFNFKTLYLINPCNLDDECYARAMHAGYIIDEAKIFSSFTKAVKDIDYLVATSSVESINDKRHLRNAIWLEELSKKLFEMDGRIGLVFGREDYGLFNEEIAACDMLLRIPTSESYPSLNLSHAVGIVLYSLYLNSNIEQKEKITLSNTEKEKLFYFFSEILKEINYPKHKFENTEIMFKRIMGRAMLSKWEFHTLMGVFSKSLENIKKNKK
jgi:TrmH family RNA methyltransferase